MITIGVLITIFIKLIVIDNNQTVYLSINMRWSESVFLLSLSIITLVIIVFGENYIISEIVAGGFWITYIAFVIGMGALILFRDMFGLFFGWEMLGISSYILVSYYHTALRRNGALKTVFTNRVGDVIFVGFIGIVLTQNTTLATFLVVIFCVCKSAQYPFSAWLPAAMAAPTPVSALVHSSTLVTAGL